MSTRLMQILTFTNVGAGATVPQAHNINVNGRALTPDFIAFDQPGFEVAASSSTSISVTNNNAAPTTVRVWLEYKQSTARWFGAEQTKNLTPQPFIASGGGVSGGGATSNVFVWDLATSWADIYTDMTAVSGPKICLVEWEYGGTRQIGPAGAYNVNEIYFIALGIPGGSAEAVIQIVDGVTFSLQDFGGGQQFGFLLSKNIYWNPVCTTTPIYTSAVNNRVFWIDLDGGGIFSANTVIDGSVALYLRNRANANSTAGAGGGMFRVRNGNDEVYLLSGSELRSRVFFDPDGLGNALAVFMDATTRYQDASDGAPSFEFGNINVSTTMRMFANRANELFSVNVNAMGTVVATPL